ncbi:MAG: SDR family NAD(P)-dependent oxidoreductase [Cellvibrionaceae bacterium]|nr:SDR family NAD(P)-dependent oxidoreductase [Cellvibrionaceae bacterium]
MKRTMTTDDDISQQKRALKKIRALKAEITRSQNRTQAPIAIVGMGCRFPGKINSPGDFWQALASSRDCIDDIPASRWNIDDYFHPDPAISGKMYVRQGGFLENVDQFDHEFFGLSYREACSMDPQQRLALEVTWDALEDAAIDPHSLAGSNTGFFLGVCTQDYARYSLHSHNPENIDVYSFTGNAPSIASGRLANILDIHGPAISVDTACSSSLVAVHMAVQSLRSGESNLVLAGGVNVILSPENFIYFCKVNALSPDARCKTFDDSANGYVRSEGCGVVVMKLLSQAISDGDPIRGIIRGSALNQDGKSHDLTAPNGTAQRHLIRQALQNANLQARDIAYVETHGTGTPLGDPIEIGALAEVYGEHRPAEAPLLLGAVKSNIGHTEAASGMAGLIKTVLCLEHGRVPANLHFQQPNRQIQWETLPLRVVDSSVEWPAWAPTRRAGISAFGFSGTNAHLILEQASVTENHHDTGSGATAPPRRSVFQRKSCWLTRPEASPVNKQQVVSHEQEHRQAVCHPLLGRPFYHCLSPHRCYESLIELQHLAYLRGHPVWGKIVLPGSAYVEMALSAAMGESGRERVAIDNIFYEEAFVLHSEAGAVQRLQMSLSEGEEGKVQFQICSLANTDANGNPTWLRHASGSFYGAEKTPPRPEDRASVQLRCQRHFDATAFYQTLEKAGYTYGSDHQGIRNAWLGEGEILCELGMPESLLYQPQSPAERYFFHPAVLDSCYQPLLMLLPEVAKDQMYVTLAKEQVIVYAAPSSRLWVHTRRRLEPDIDPMMIKADVSICDDEGNVVAETLGYVMARTAAKRLDSSEPTLNDGPVDSHLYQTCWQALAAPAFPGTANTGNGASSPLGSDELTLILADRQGYGLALCAQWVEQGRSCVLWHRGEWLNRLATAPQWALSGGDTQDFSEAFEQLRNQASSKDEVAQIIYAWSLDDTLPTSAGTAVESPGMVSLVALLQCLLNQGIACRVTVLTHGAQQVSSNRIDPAPASSEQEEVNPLQALYWGFVDSAQEELAQSPMPGLRLRCMDIDFPHHQDESIKGLLPALFCQQSESSLSLRNGVFYAPRVRVLEHQPGPLALRLARRGDLSSLSWVPQPRRGLQANQVEVETLAIGLNLRDIFDALGLHPRQLEQFGLECSGRVTAVGEGVTRVAVGDSVIAFGTGCFAQFTNVDEDRVARLPGGMSWEQGATLPIAFLTAAYALTQCARIQPGERVLIHAAAGGVGMAAVQLALNAGAEVFATASESKLESLRALGVKHISDSRRLSFLDDVNRWTRNEGVDVVLNSLADEFIDKSVEALRSGGRFIEIGLRGWSQQTMKARRPDVDYHLVNLMAKWESDGGDIRNLLDEVLAMFARGELQALPVESFGSIEVEAAFRHMQQGKHIGKVVIRQTADASIVEGRNGKAYDAAAHDSVAKERTQLISGGLGAIGLKVAEYLVGQGHRNIALLSRRPPDAKAENALAAFRDRGARVELYSVDIAAPQLAETLEDIRHKHGPITGIYHCAGFADNKPIRDLDAGNLQRVFRAKVAGTWQLHRLTLNDSLNHFVLFSSAATMLGSAGAANYAAANAFLNGFAQYRNAIGLPAVSLAWGPWAGTGMYQDLSQANRQRLQRDGWRIIDDQQNLSHLSQLQARQGVIGVLSIDWSQWLKRKQSDDKRAVFAALQEPGPVSKSRPKTGKTNEVSRPALSRLASNAVKPGDSAWINELKQRPRQESQQWMEDFLRGEFADVLALEYNEVDMRQGFFDLGLDSLTSIEFRNKLQSRLGRKLPVTLFYDYPTVLGLADFLLTHFGIATEQQALTGTSDSATENAPKNNGAEPQPEAFQRIAEASDLELLNELMRK